MKNFAGSFTLFVGALLGFSPSVQAQASLLQTIDLKAWTGVPVTIVQPPPPQPAPGFSLTGIAFNPLSNTIYVSDYATTNVYAIDSATRTVTSAVYTNGLFSTADIGPIQNLPGTAPKVVLVNPLTNRWLFMGQGGGAQFSSTAFAEAENARAFQSGGAWDPTTGNVYGTDGIEFFATNNLKFLFGGYPCAGASNAVAVNPMTSRVYVSCGNSQTGGGLVIYDGVALSQANAKIPTAPLASAHLGAQPTGLAVNPNSNRVYVAGMTSPTSLDVLDASTYQVLASIPGLPDQSTDYLIAGFNLLPLPRPVAVNTLTNTIFVVNSVTSTISVFDGKTNSLTGTIAIPTPAGAVVSQAPDAQMSEIKPGNTFYDFSTGMRTTLGGTIAVVVDESANLLYVANVTGTVGVYALATPSAPAAFSVNGVVRNAQGVPVAGVTVNATGLSGSATAVTDATGLFVLTGFTAGYLRGCPRIGVVLIRTGIADRIRERPKYRRTRVPGQSSDRAKQLHAQPVDNDRRRRDDHSHGHAESARTSRRSRADSVRKRPESGQSLGDCYGARRTIVGLLPGAGQRRIGDDDCDSDGHVQRWNCERQPDGRAR